MPHVDEPLSDHILDDLKGIMKGELLFDDLARAMYSTDASIFQVMPLGVAVPRDEEDLQALVRYAAEHHIPLIARGAGSGLAGEALGSGIVVDLSQHLRAILEIGVDTVRVQPGVVHRELNVALAQVGRRFAPDPASSARCTLGGMLATNASGARALLHGYTRDHVAGMRILLDSGEAAAIGKEARFSGATGRLADIVAAVAALLGKNDDLIQRHQPWTRFNRCGYLFDGVLTAETVDLPRLLVGSEGTLAFFTEATLRTIPLSAGRALVLLCFTNLDAALRAAQACLSSGPSACELIDHRFLTLARERDPVVAALVPAEAAVVLLVEYEADSPAEAARAANELAERFRKSDPQAGHAVTATEPQMIERLWNLREAAMPTLYGLRGGPPPLAFIEDVGVPVESLPVYLRYVQDILQKHETTASFLIHAGTGQVHTRPFLDLQRPEDSAKLWAIAEEAHSLALSLHGTVSTQHGTGLARTPWVARQVGPLYDVLRELKAIFDPQQLLNPGKIIGPDPDKPAWPLRGALKSSPTALVLDDGAAPAEENPSSSVAAERNGRAETTSASPQLRWQPGEMHTEVLQCNGCAQCRTESPAERMCPIFRATHAEAATPRAKANLLRDLLQNHDPRALSSDDVRTVADLCVNCKMCALECPAHVAIPKLMLEAKAANVAKHGLTRSDWVLARTESFAAFGSNFAILVNAALANPLARWLLEKMFDVSRIRRLPKFAARSFLKRAARRGLTKPLAAANSRVAYFVDVFANYNDPQIAEAVVAVLRHNGIEVFVPPGQVGCGMAPLAQGDVDTAREAGLANLRVLADLAREGYLILCSEPTAALMLKQDYLDLIDHPDVGLVASRVVEFTSFLWDLHRQGRLRTDFTPLNLSLGHHVPCHLKALGQEPAGPALLALIPSLRVRTIDVSCSGMAGTFGLRAGNYAISREAGKPMLQALASPEVRYGSTECGPCRLQMEDGAGKRTLHPAQYLALAYGLMPELSRRLEQPIRRLVLQ